MKFDHLRPQTPTDDTPLDFGCHRGRTPNQLAARGEWGYLLWLADTVRPRVVSRRLRDLAAPAVDDHEDDWLDYWDFCHDD